ncbi:MAG: hypothetical protein R2713_02340 [Ilumatobacteraceae bacterium]
MTVSRASSRSQGELKAVNYLADEGIAGVAFLADRLGKPVLVEGPAGTEQGREAGQVDRRGDRLAAHPSPVLRGPRRVEGALRVELKQLLFRIQADKNSDSWTEVHDDIFSDEFLLCPLLGRSVPTIPWCC